MNILQWTNQACIMQACSVTYIFLLCQKYSCDMLWTFASLKYHNNHFPISILLPVIANMHDNVGVTEL